MTSENTEKPPICDHCGEAKSWFKDKRRIKGGTWRCAKRLAETRRKYEQSEAGKARRKRGDKKYRSSEKGKQKRREQQQRYIRTENGKKTRKTYEETPKYYVIKRKYLLRKMHNKIIQQLEELQNVK